MPDVPIPYLGETLSIAAALSWAFGVIFFKKAGEGLPPLALNVFKGVVALLVLTPTIPLAGETLAPDVPAATWLLLAVSGVLGVAVSDTLFFISLEKLGAGLTAVVDTVYTPIFLGLSFLWLGERMDASDLCGAGLIVVALLVGSASRPPPGRSRRDLVVGSVLGITGIAVMGVSIVMIKKTLNELPVLWSTWVRLLGGTVAVLPLIACSGDRRRLIEAMRPSRSWRWAVPASIAGTYLAMICWIAGLKYTSVSRAALLNQLSTIFIFALATVILREPLTLRRVGAIALALTGALLVLG